MALENCVSVQEENQTNGEAIETLHSFGRAVKFCVSGVPCSGVTARVP
jgi:hypothetical protein